jgi:hypothetical protein
LQPPVRTIGGIEFFAVQVDEDRRRADAAREHETQREEAVRHAPAFVAEVEVALLRPQRGELCDRRVALVEMISPQRGIAQDEDRPRASRRVDRLLEVRGGKLFGQAAPVRMPQRTKCDVERDQDRQRDGDRERPRCADCRSLLGCVRARNRCR